MTTHPVVYFTFGVVYATETHPAPYPVHPNGWWEVHGLTFNDALKVVHALTGGQYAFSYMESDFEGERAFYPFGALFVIDATPTSTKFSQIGVIE